MDSTATVPVEVLVYIFGHLDPWDLKLMQLVCKRWRYIVQEDGCWKQAIEIFFGHLPTLRVDSTCWKAEYMFRFKLLKELKRTKKVQSFNARVQSIDKIMVIPEQEILYACSTSSATVSICHLDSSKIEKDPIASRDMVIFTGVVMDKSRILVTNHQRIFLCSDISQRTMSSFPLSDGLVTCLNFVPKQPDRFLVGLNSGVISMWNISTSSAFNWLLPSKERPQSCFGFSCGIVVGFESGKVGILPMDLFATQLTQTECLMIDLDGSVVLDYLADYNRELLCVVGTNPLSKYPIHLLSIRGKKLIASYGAVSSEGVTAFAWTVGNKDEDLSQPILAAAGCVAGSIFVWKISNNHLSNKSTLYTIHNAHTEKVVALTLDSVKVVSAASDGSIKLWNVITGQLISTFHIKVRRSIEQGHDPILLWTYRQTVVACCGNTVKCWNFEKVAKLNISRKSRRKSEGLKANTDSTSSRKHHREEPFHRLVKDELSHFEEQKEEIAKDLARRRQLMKKINGTTDELAEDYPCSPVDDDLLKIAMMISLEEMEKKPTSKFSPDAEAMFQMDDFPPTSIKKQSSKDMVESSEVEQPVVCSPRSLGAWEIPIKIKHEQSPAVIRSFASSMSEDDQIRYALELSKIEQ